MQAKLTLLRNGMAGSLRNTQRSLAAEHAKGALTRLNSEGREITLQAKDVSGEPVDLKSMRGKAVVVQYWTTSSDVCVADHAVLKDLIAKYGGKSLEVISINLDYNREELSRIS